MRRRVVKKDDEGKLKEEALPAAKISIAAHDSSTRASTFSFFLFPEERLSSSHYQHCHA